MQDWEEEEIVACYVRKRIRKNINIMFWKKKLKKNKNEESQDLPLFQQRLQEKQSYRNYESWPSSISKKLIWERGHGFINSSSNLG